MIIDLISFRYLKIIMKQSTILLEYYFYEQNISPCGPLGPPPPPPHLTRIFFRKFQRIQCVLGYVLACILLRGCPILIIFFLCVWFLAPLLFSPEKGEGAKAPLPPPPGSAPGTGRGVSPLPRCKENGNQKTLR